ncbi:MAG: hypothetical protein RLZZ488_2046 [Pseudomonadota bacterium]|jgi:hypothetical protein
MKTRLIVGSLALISQTACKSRFFSFMPEPVPAATATAGSADSQSGQIAIGQQGSDNASGQQQLPANQAASYKPLQATSQKIIALGKTAEFDVDGKKVSVSFVKVLEDSRCPKDVVCIWEGQARLQFEVAVPELKISKSVEVTLRAGHPQLAQVSVGPIAIDLIGLTPDTTTNTTTAQRSSPEATIVAGRAP